MLRLKICANVECCHDSVASWMLAQLWCKWSFDVAQCKYWCNFNASASANVECCRGFMTKMNVGIASVRMKCWRGFVAKTSIGMTSVLMWSVVMASWQKWIVDVASWLRYEWSVDVASMQIKCWGSFMEKKSASTASVQGKMLAWLHGKDSWCGYVAKTLEMAALKRQVLVQLNCQEKHAAYKNKQQQRACQKKISWHV